MFTVETVWEYKSSTRIEYYVKAKSHYKAKNSANNVEIFIPVPSDSQQPTFKVLKLEANDLKYSFLDCQWNCYIHSRQRLNELVVEAIPRTEGNGHESNFRPAFSCKPYDSVPTSFSLTLYEI